jgi:hypothetical protein
MTDAEEPSEPGSDATYVPPDAVCDGGRGGVATLVLCATRTAVRAAGVVACSRPLASPCSSPHTRGHTHALVCGSPHMGYLMLVCSNDQNPQVRCGPRVSSEQHWNSTSSRSSSCGGCSGRATMHAAVTPALAFHGMCARCGACCDDSQPHLTALAVPSPVCAAPCCLLANLPLPAADAAMDATFSASSGWWLGGKYATSPGDEPISCHCRPGGRPIPSCLPKQRSTFPGMPHYAPCPTAALPITPASFRPCSTPPKRSRSNRLRDRDGDYDFYCDACTAAGHAPPGVCRL